MSYTVRFSAVRGLSVAAVLAVTQVAWAAPAAGEFSAADEVATPTAQVVLTHTGAHARMSQGHAGAAAVNGEVAPPAPVASVPSPAPAQLRSEGRQALRSHTLSVGDVSL